MFKVWTVHYLASLALLQVLVWRLWRQQQQVLQRGPVRERVCRAAWLGLLLPPARPGGLHWQTAALGLPAPVQPVHALPVRGLPGQQQQIHGPSIL